MFSFWSVITFSFSHSLTRTLSFSRSAIKVIRVFYSLLIYVLIITIICISLFILIFSSTQFLKIGELTLIFVVPSYFFLFWHYVAISTFIIEFLSLTSTKTLEDPHLFRLSIFPNWGAHSLSDNIMCQSYPFLFSFSFHFFLSLFYLNSLFILFFISNLSYYF